ncbi:MAG: hypothetical protein EXR48_04030 [Dehalococcoidia bacterium]|nr:hypothetical protein [Dehalococcoidia bacterium]
MRIALLGEDVLHVRLLAQNLEHRVHAVEVQVLGQDGEWERQLRNILDPSTILLLDLGRFDAARAKQYQRFAQQCNATTKAALGGRELASQLGEALLCGAGDVEAVCDGALGDCSAGLEPKESHRLA